MRSVTAAFTCDQGEALFECFIECRSVIEMGWIGGLDF